MSLKENKFVKKYLENEKSIFEGIAVCFVTALALTAIFTGSFREVTSIEFVKNTSLLKVILIFVFAAILSGVLYHTKKIWAKVVMFGAVMVYFLMAAYSSSHIDFTSTTKNPIGQICFLAFTGFLAVIAFLYVKDDVFKIQERVSISNRTLKIYTLLVGIFLLAITTVIGVYKYASYTAPTFDFGIFAQGYEYMKQTGLLKTTVERGHEISHFANHFSPIFYIGLPLYFIVPRAETVAVIQSIMVALPVIPIYLLGKQYKLSNKVIVAIMAIYALFPATVGGILYDIHENCFLTFMILMFIWAVEKKRNILMVVFLLLTLFVKEDAAMYVMLLGAFWIASKKDRLRGLISVVVGGIYFIIAIKIVSSFGYGIMDFRYGNLFYDQSGGIIQIVRVLFTNPGYLFTQIIANDNAQNMDKIGYIITMFVPLGALIFTTGKKYSRYILLGSIALLSLMTTYLYQHQIEFQYNFGHIALILYIIMMNVADMKHKKRKKMLASSLIICAIMFMGLILPKAPRYVHMYYDNQPTIEKFNNAVSMVPNDKSVFTTGWIMPHMSKNLQVYDIGYLDEKHKEGVPEYPDYLLVDERESDAATQFAKYVNSGKYELVYDGNSDGVGTNTGSKLVSLYKLKK